VDHALLILIFLIGVALLFDFLNGLHDAANSIATIVATRVLPPVYAVGWAAFFNFIAFLFFGLHVANTIGKGIIDPAIISDQVIFGALMGAIAWNVVTWMAGIPSSSSHALVGGLLGALGQGVAATLTLRVEPVLPWLMAAGLVASAFEVGRHLPALPWLARASRGLARAAVGLDPTTRAGLFGAATPLLPCGLLYGMFLAAVATGSGPAGAGMMLLFALGGVPALAGTQASAGLGERFPTASRFLRRAVPLAAAAVLVWRALAAGPGVEPPQCH